jgi:hypothetical protein
MQARPPSLQRRPQGQSLQLPSLPRFHPANFPSSHGSTHSTPDGSSAMTSPQPPMSPRTHQRMYSDAQKQLYLHQREVLSAAARVTSPGPIRKPISPRLQPLGSPGPVTPLELEGAEGYLIGGVRSTSANNAAPSAELVEKFIQQEARRQRNSSPSSTRPTSR